MKTAHIIPVEKFTELFVEFINNNFNSDEHSLLAYGNIEYTTIKKKGDIIILTRTVESLILLIKSLYNSKKIIIHGLFSPHLVLLLYLQPWLLKKCYWCIWGGDLYYHIMRKKTVKSDAYEYLRKSVIKRIGGLITHVEGDYELAKKWYGAKGKYYYSFMYPSNLYKELNIIRREDFNETIVIQLGNSADPSNNHLEVLDKLQRYTDMDIEIICPLSYGDKAYAEEVINKGKAIFGDKFIPLTEFMPFDEYLEILAKIDIAIFNHKRQQAMGNITTLLGLGKKVYIREEITTWKFCIDHDLKVYSANGNYDNLFEEMDEKIKQKNIENVKIKFSEEKLVEDLKKIFDEEID